MELTLNKFSKNKNKKNSKIKYVIPCIMFNYSNAEQLSVRKSFILLSSPSQKTSFRSKQEEKKRILISFASSVPEYKPTEKAYFCRLNAVSLDRLSVKKKSTITTLDYSSCNGKFTTAARIFADMTQISSHFEWNLT